VVRAWKMKRSCGSGFFEAEEGYNENESQLETAANPSGASPMKATDAGFELQGNFAGFFRDVFGRRRMALRVAGDEIYLKVPKALRRELDGALVRGQEIVVMGRDSSEDGRGARVVTQVRIAGNAACISCPIRVCAKKNCWRNGGKELWKALQAEIAAGGLAETVKLKAVDCLDHCKKGPNAECGGHDFHHCTPGQAREILAQFTE